MDLSLAALAEQLDVSLLAVPPESLPPLLLLTVLPVLWPREPLCFLKLPLSPSLSLPYSPILLEEGGGGISDLLCSLCFTSDFLLDTSPVCAAHHSWPALPSTSFPPGRSSAFLSL